MKLKSILLEKLPGSVKAKMLSLERIRSNTQWKFTLRLIDPILKDVSMKWGYVTTALNSEDFDRKKVEGIYNDFKSEVLDNADKWVFVTKKAPKKRTYGVRQIIEAEVEAIPKNTEQLQEPIDPNNPKTEPVVLNTKKMKLMDKVRGIELYEKPYKYPYEPIKTAPAETGTGTGETGSGTGTGTDTGKSTSNITITNNIKPGATGPEAFNQIKYVQNLIVDKLKDTPMKNHPSWASFVNAKGDYGNFGPLTKKIVAATKKAANIQDGTVDITPELVKKLEEL